MKFDLKYLEKLAKLMSDSELTEMQLEDQEQSIVLKRENKISQQPDAQVIVKEPANVPAPVDSEPKEGKAIKSPMVGTFYKAASPDAPAFVEVGSLVAQGEVVCIIEAMKLMNEIESDFSGKVVKICVDDGQPVEYGQVLMYIE